MTPLQHPMTTVAVFAHFDPGGCVAPHVERYLAALSATANRLMVVSTADLSRDGRRSIERYGELILRENVGYDFYSWKVGLDGVRDWEDYDRVLICNDSVIGPYRPLPRILDEMARRRLDFWGITQSKEIEPHVQSWFVVFERPVLQSGLLHGFWRAMTPVSDRYWVIRRYEIGMSRLLRTAGFRMDSYFRPNAHDRVKAAMRYRHYLRRQGGPVVGLRGLFEQSGWNPAIACWDAALDGRLPFTKIDVLRDDPYRIGDQTMLAMLEKAHPDALADVRKYLDRTRADYRRLRAWTADWAG